MYSDIPLFSALIFLVGGLLALTWSSDFFIDGASALAKVLGISPFVIGMVIIGFGTSAPELCVSTMSGISGHSNLSLGNAYGSCIFNILVILGVASMIHPIKVKPSITFVAVPCLVAISAFSWFLLKDGSYSRSDAFWQLALFAVLLPAYCWFDQQGKKKPSDESVPPVANGRSYAGIAALKVFVGLGVLIGSSHFLVWGAVDVARSLGISELIIGLTVLAVGTSLPELASAVAAARKGKHEFVLGNIIGSNFFNTLAVVGLAGGISPITEFSPYILTRDLPLMIGASVLISVFGVNFGNLRKGGRIVRFEGALWTAAFAAYTLLMLYQEVK
ncbi:MAG: calcium/sodium antiporter [Kiritimatiellae bacterium]|nr:calcium/sodium antiporter [Kiritimatiellia bacterium]